MIGTQTEQTGGDDVRERICLKKDICPEELEIPLLVERKAKSRRRDLTSEAEH